MERDAGPVSYRARGDRCEGVYRRRVSSSRVHLVSFTTASELRDLCSGPQQVRLLVPPAAFTQSGSRSVHIQAESLRPLLYYRMDVDLRQQAPEFAWPWDPRCNNVVRLTAPELGVIASAPVRIGAKEEEVVVPVALSFESRAVTPPYRALLMPSGRVREVFVSLWHYGTVASPVAVVVDRPLNARPYPAQTPIAVTFDARDVKTPGLYRARLNVEFDTNQAETLDFFFLGARW